MSFFKTIKREIAEPLFQKANTLGKSFGDAFTNQIRSSPLGAFTQNEGNIKAQLSDLGTRTLSGIQQNLKDPATAVTNFGPQGLGTISSRITTKVAKPIKSILKGVSKEGQDLLKESVYNGLKKLEFHYPNNRFGVIEGEVLKNEIMQKIEKGVATADDIRAGNELIKLMESNKSFKTKKEPLFVKK